MLPRALFAVTAALAIASPFAHAEKAHVHGVAELNVSVERDTLQIALESPLDSLLGFERGPQGKQELDRVRRMANRLREGDKLFVPFPGYRQIRAQVVTGKRQSAARLSPKASTLRW
jgi:hypothetical protein